MRQNPRPKAFILEGSPFGIRAFSFARLPKAAEEEKTGRWLCSVPVKIEIAPETDTVTALLTGEIDHHGAGQLREAIDDSVRRTCPRTLVLDFGGVEFMDSSGIGLVLGRYRLMQDMGGKLTLRNMPPHIRRVMRVAGINSLDIQGKGGDKG